MMFGTILLSVDGSPVIHEEPVKIPTQDASSTAALALGCRNSILAGSETGFLGQGLQMGRLQVPFDNPLSPSL